MQLGELLNLGESPNFCLAAVMARASYGQQTKKRAKCFLTALLAYANDALDESYEEKLNVLRPQIQVRWLTEKRLVVRTKVRFLQELTGLSSPETPLKAEQIKEALKRFTDFLEILEDNRPTRGGSENWHFTLNLWYSRFESQANLEKFEQEWESRRSTKMSRGKSSAISMHEAGVSSFQDPCKEVKSSFQDTRRGIKSSFQDTGRDVACYVSTAINWQEICHASLEAQHHRRLTTNPLTSVDGINFELDEVYVPLGLVERKQRERRSGDISAIRGSQLYEADETQITRTFTVDGFLQQVLYPKNTQRIAIIGEAGAGKTTLLQKIAAWLLDNTQDLPVWISLADLQGKTLEDYLVEDWLKAAIRKRKVPPEIEEAFCEQFNQGRVWLLLDAVDEMAIESSHALAQISNFLQGWVGDATVVLTCRLNVWDAGKNACSDFDTFRNLNFTYGNNQTPDLVKKFINSWFRDNQSLAVNLRTELDKLERQRIKDAVKNPLRLALMCRIWGLQRGGLPDTKAILYQQFVEAIYEWKQDRFPTTLEQRHQLNKALGKLALQAITQAKTRFRLRHSFVLQVLGTPDAEMFQLALQIGWLNQVGISDTQGEKVYAFYHPTFQEYFAALAIEDWGLGMGNGGLGIGDGGLASGNEKNISQLVSYRIFESQWREVILLWLGRDDIPQHQKQEFIRALIEFRDGCGGCYSYQAYFLAAQGVAEFTDNSLSQEIVTQLIKWRFGYFHPKQQKWWRYHPLISEGARVALLKTDRKAAIAALEKFILSNPNSFESWNAAYSLGKTFDPGNQIAVEALEQLVLSLRNDSLLWQAADSLGKVKPGSQIAIAALSKIIESTKKDSIRRKAAYSLGKIEPGNLLAISTLEQIITSTKNDLQRQQAAENLLSFDANHPLALQESKQKNPNQNQSQKNKNRKSSKRKTKKKSNPNFREITALIENISSTKNEDAKRRKASRLAKLQPGNSLAFATLLDLVKSAQSDSVRKNTTDDFKKVLLDEQIPQLIVGLKDCFADDVTEDELEDFRHCYKLLWHCSQKMSYIDFYQLWHQ